MVICLVLGVTKVVVGHKLESRALITDSEYYVYAGYPGPEVIKLFSCSIQLSIEFKLFINAKVTKIN